MTRRATILSATVFALAACPAETKNNAEGNSNDESANTGIVTVTETDSDTSSASQSTTQSQDTSGSGSDSSTGFDPDNCGEVDFELVAVPPNVVLVLDKSRSMVSDNDADDDGELDGFWDHDADPMTPVVSRWNSLYNVVDFVVTSFDAQINFGAVLFPGVDATNQYGPGSCIVDDVPDIDVQAMAGEEILSTIPGPDDVSLQGATPATAGIQTALDHLATLDPDVPQFLIFVTDGAANCSADFPTAPELIENYDANLPILVGSAFTDSEIPTFVVGIDIVDAELGEGNDGVPLANTFVELNTVAEAGGRARDGAEKFFNTANEIELMEALGEIAGQVVSCIIPLDPEPLNPDFVTVDIGGQSFDRIEDCASEDGWMFVNPDGPYDALELCGAACEAYVEASLVDVTYGCPPAG
jgi:hypothetical protein